MKYRRPAPPPAQAVPTVAAIPSMSDAELNSILNCFVRRGRYAYLVMAAEEEIANRRGRKPPGE